MTYRTLDSAADAMAVLEALRDAIAAGRDPLDVAIRIIEELDKRDLAIVEKS